MKKSVLLSYVMLFAFSQWALPGKPKVRATLAAYKTVEIAAVRFPQGQDIPRERIDLMYACLSKKISEIKYFTVSESRNTPFPAPGSQSGGPVVGEGTGKGEDGTTLVVAVDVTKYDEGSQAGRYLMPGVGGGKLEGDVYLLNKSTGAQIHRFQTYGSGHIGIFGGGSDKIVKGFASRVAEFFKGGLVEDPKK